MAIETRPIVDDELDRYMDLCQGAFGGKPEPGEGERIRDVIGLDRVTAAFDGPRMVGTGAAYGLRLSVPGTDRHPGATGDGPPPGVASAGLTRVSVAATHRRRGVLTALLGAHFADATGRGEPLSVLWASELPIYGRFGYGPASDALRLGYDARRAEIRRPDRPDELAFAEADEAVEVLPDLRERTRVGRPGHFHRPAIWWARRSFADHEFMREGAGPRQTVVARRDGRPVGYATYRLAPKWTDEDLPDGTVKVIEVAGIDLGARHTLWWYLSNIDLHPHVTYWSLPLDSELPWLAADQRAVIRHLTDGLQVRVLDVVAALQGRRWARPGHLVFDLDDRHHPVASGRYRLTVSDDGTGRVESTDREPDLRLHPAALGALYLGSRAPDALMVAGWLEGDRAARAAAGRLFAWPVAAWCDEMF
jgi:predicted acetyltransferase